MIKIGDRVKPLQKTIFGELSKSIVWKRAQSVNQNFLYVIDIITKSGKEILILKDKMATEGGDFYRPSDVINYEPKNWEVNYFSEEKIKEKQFDLSMDWIEIHENEDSMIRLMKYKEEFISENQGYPYVLSVNNQYLENWAEENYNECGSIKKARVASFMSDNLDCLIGFLEDIKKQI